MKIYLDDERQTPNGWTRAFWPQEVISMLQDPKLHIEEVSLDHDLGDDKRGTGYDVLLWIEEAVATRGFVPPSLNVHSANSSAREKMEAAIRTINRIHAAQKSDTEQELYLSGRENPPANHAASRIIG